MLLLLENNVLGIIIDSTRVHGLQEKSVFALITDI